MGDQERQRAPKNTRAFTDLAIRRLRPPAHGQELYWDEGCPGLALLVGPRTKTFRVQFKLHSQYVMATIGRFGEMVPDAPNKENVQLSKARDIAADWRAKAKEGIDPRKPKREANDEAAAKEADPTYGQVVDQFIAHYAKPRQRTWDQTERVLKSCKRWLNRPMLSIDKKEVRALLRQFVADGHPYKANVTQAWLKKLWRWAYAEDIVGEPIMDAVTIVEKRERNRVFGDDEIKATWNAASQLGAVESAYVKLLILLAPRKTALACLHRSHLDDAHNPTLWTTPFELTKSRKNATKKRVYLTPLPPLAQRIIKGLAGNGDDQLFPGLGVHETVTGRPHFDGAELQRKLVAHGAPADFTFHAWRHTVATWLENAGYSEWERGLALNHSGGGSVTAGYSHGYPLDLKRTLLCTWADHVERPVQPAGATLLR